MWHCKAFRCVQVWILKGRSDELYRSMWVQAMDAMLARLVGIADKDQLQYVGNMNGYDHRFKHCTQQFLPMQSGSARL